MKKSRYREEQIIGILKQSEAGVKTADLCREHGISAATFYGWKQKFGGMDVSEAQRLKALEDENRRLKLLVAELSLHGEALKGVIRGRPESKTHQLEKTENPPSRWVFCEPGFNVFGGQCEGRTHESRF
jgi:putative transposase